MSGGSGGVSGGGQYRVEGRGKGGEKGGVCIYYTCIEEVNRVVRHVHVLMRDEKRKEERSKQDQTNIHVYTCTNPTLSIYKKTSYSCTRTSCIIGISKAPSCLLRAVTCSTGPARREVPVSVMALQLLQYLVLFPPTVILEGECYQSFISKAHIHVSMYLYMKTTM